MTTLREAAQQALDYWQQVAWGDAVMADKMDALRAALAEPVQPVAWMYTGVMSNGIEHGPHLIWKPECMDAMSASKGVKAAPLYTAPPKAEPVQEPVAWMVYTLDGKSVCVTDNPADFGEGHRALPLYTAPPKTEPLSGEQLRQIELGLRIYYDNDKYDLSLHDFARAIERAHGIGDSNG